MHIICILFYTRITITHDSDQILTWKEINREIQAKESELTSTLGYFIASKGRKITQPQVDRAIVDKWEMLLSFWLLLLLQWEWQMVCCSDQCVSSFS